MSFKIGRTSGWNLGEVLLYGIFILLPIAIYNGCVSLYNIWVRHHNAKIPSVRWHSVKSKWTESNGRVNEERSSECYVKPSWAR